MNKNTPLYTWLALAQTVLTYIIASSFISILFSLIDQWVKDSLTYSNAAVPNFSMATALIAVPLLILISYYLGKLYQGNQDLFASKLKKWIGYFTLFIGGIVLAGDLVFVIYYFFTGNLVTGFIYKATVVAVITVWFFASVLHELKKELYTVEIGRVYNALALIVVTVLLITTAFSVFGTPSEQRKQNLDVETSNRLSTLNYEVSSYSSLYNRLPQELSDLEVYVSRYDEGISYEIIDEKTYKLCANFESVNDGSRRNGYLGGSSEKFYVHGVGQKCYEDTVNILPTPTKIIVN